MPFKSETVEAEEFLTYKDITVYHTYRNDDIDEGAREYWYTTDPYGWEDGNASFDVRNLIIDLEKNDVDTTDLREKLLDLGDDLPIVHEHLITFAIDHGVVTDKKDG